MYMCLGKPTEPQCNNHITSREHFFVFVFQVTILTFYHTIPTFNDPEKEAF